MHKRRASTFFSHLMRSCASRYLISKMVSAATLIFFLFLFFATTAGGEKKKSVDKIIIHVPYKIHKHHHTHTKYKVITIPAPKKENTVIYLKEQIQPVIKEVPVAHTQVEVTETQPHLPKTIYQAPEMIIPPHQESAQSFLESISDQNDKNLGQIDQQKEYSTIADDQKPLETHSGHNMESYVSNFSYKPMFSPPQANLIHNFSFKPMPPSPHHAFTSKFFMNPDIHQSFQNFLPKFSYQPMLHLPQHHLTSPYKFKPFQPNPKPLQDSVAHTSSQVYKTIIPGPKSTTYQVKEENQEGKATQSVKHQPTSNAIPVPSMKFRRKGKTYAQFGHNYQLKNLNKFASGTDYEYEHVGYLIIDGNSQKLVGKNFKDELLLSR